ncbi:GNAT family N-acetyltransferase [Acanthopleuribacter pedis]|uniref:GNAT family N-acetyltransferase n=1 Tax=Acanthopleuribacter pedis TaxID=442870 RepID=A0A8J7U418_9BACT|nr:GNAT family N-acetyltransferase [Acanthopleuribacter pedis]MBO1321018.1 GNAT family N-acetyltransferase [Acanthopleuribacter pedis]
MQQNEHETPNLRPMRAEDIDRVLEIIYDHDEDDAATAEYTYRESGLTDKFVLVHEDDILGTTGFNAVEDTDRTYWLSWTYLDDDYQGKGYGRLMMEGLFDILQARSARKIFLTTSDYQDEEDGDIYESARAFYVALGFVEELRHKDFYAPGETMIYYGYRFPGLAEAEPVSEAEQAEEKELGEDEEPLIPGALITGISEIPETKDAYGLEWRYTQDGTYFDAAMIEKVLAKAREWNARTLFASFPSDLEAIEALLGPKGFKQHGRLVDFFEDGIDDCHWRFDFQSAPNGGAAKGKPHHGGNKKRRGKGGRR